MSSTADLFEKEDDLRQLTQQIDRREQELKKLDRDQNYFYDRFIQVGISLKMMDNQDFKNAYNNAMTAFTDKTFAIKQTLKSNYESQKNIEKQIDKIKDLE